MKLQELSFADHAAIEILPALLKHIGYISDAPEKEAARHAYRFADALAAERDRRASNVAHERAELTRRAERAETTIAVLRSDTRDMQALWNELRVDNHPAALLEICRLRRLAGISDD